MALLALHLERSGRSRDLPRSDSASFEEAPGREKAKYVVLEDNDPTGYKSNKALEAKRDLGIQAMQFPRYSPDLNPLDFYLWDAIERRMRAAKTAPMSVAAYKARLRRVAMSIPEAEIREAVLSIKARAKAVCDAKGGDIAHD